MVRRATRCSKSLSQQGARVANQKISSSAENRTRGSASALPGWAEGETRSLQFRQNPSSINSSNDAGWATADNDEDLLVDGKPQAVSTAPSRIADPLEAFLRRPLPSSSPHAWAVPWPCAGCAARFLTAPAALSSRPSAQHQKHQTIFPHFPLSLRLSLYPFPLAPHRPSVPCMQAQLSTRSRSALKDARPVPKPRSELHPRAGAHLPLSLPSPRGPCACAALLSHKPFPQTFTRGLNVNFL